VSVRRSKSARGISTITGVVGDEAKSVTGHNWRRTRARVSAKIRWLPAGARWGHRCPRQAVHPQGRTPQPAAARGCGSAPDSAHPEPVEGPAGTAQHAVIVLKRPLAALTGHAHRCGNGALSRRQNRSHHQHLRPFPDAFTQRSLEPAQDCCNRRRQRVYGSPLLGRGCEEATLPLSFCRVNG
jgi:hypothetical protein